jgi:hypothetical protein
MRNASVNFIGIAMARRGASRTVAAITLLVIACGLGGCAGGANNSFAMASNDGPTITFESIDGPPPQVFDRMVNVLESESKLRSLSIVSRESPAAYRVRSYLAAEVSHGRTVIAWVWDVYDRNQQRALRLSGEEPANKPGRDPWTAADDLVLRKVAQAGLSGLSSMINGMAPVDAPPATPAPEPAGKGGPAVASAETAWPAPGEVGVLASGSAFDSSGSALAYSDH